MTCMSVDAIYSQKTKKGRTTFSFHFFLWANSFGNNCFCRTELFSIAADCARKVRELILINQKHNTHHKYNTDHAQHTNYQNHHWTCALCNIFKANLYLRFTYHFPWIWLHSLSHLCCMPLNADCKQSTKLQGFNILVDSASEKNSIAPCFWQKRHAEINQAKLDSNFSIKNDRRNSGGTLRHKETKRRQRES